MDDRIDGIEHLRATAARLHGVAERRLIGRDADAVHEAAALMEQRAEALLGTKTETRPARSAENG